MQESESAQELDSLESQARRLRLKKELLELGAEAGVLEEQRQLDLQLKAAQLRKAKAEAESAARVTPLLESIKLVSSLVIGIGGAIAGIAGFQFAKVERAEAEVAKRAAENQRQLALAETEKLRASQEQLRGRLDRVGAVLDESSAVARKLHDDTALLLRAVSRLEARLALDPDLRRLVRDGQSRQLDLTDSIYAATRKRVELLSGKAVPTARDLVEDMFGETLEGRLSAFELLILFYRNDETVIPLIVSKASADRKNANGIYNAFAALSMMPREKLRSHRHLIEPLKAVADQIGPRTQRKVQEVADLMGKE
jgi:hypothetical protein